MRMMLVAAVLGAAFAVPAKAAEPVYQKLADAGCRTTATDEGGATQLCAGPDGTPFLVVDGDLRISVTFGGVGAQSEPPFQSFGPFNDIGETIEWRMEGGSAVAAILRWTIETGEPDVKGSVLVVSKVGEGTSPGCVVAYIDARANPDANELAREAADQIAPNADCAIHMPLYYGARGAAAGEPMLSPRE